MGFIKLGYLAFSFLLATLNFWVWLMLDSPATVWDVQPDHRSSEQSDEKFLQPPKILHSTRRPPPVGWMRSTPGFNWREHPVVFITSYMHGGSSIFGSIFQKHPQATYFYEPLDALYSSLYQTSPFLWPSEYLNWPNGTYRRKSQRLQEVVANYFKSLQECSFRHLPANITHSLQRHNNHNCYATCTDPSPRYLRFTKAMEENSKITLNKSCNSQTKFSFLECCFPYIEEDCKRSKFLALKLLRFDPEDFEDYLKKHTNVFLIHHVRDPRAIVQSFIKDGDAPTTKAVTDLARNLCNVMQHNHKHVNHAMLHQPARVTVVKHEDFTKDPLAASRQIYKFLGLGEVPKLATRWLREQTNGTEDVGKFKRRNSTETAWKWTRTMSQTHINIVRQQCAHMSKDLHALGYVL